MAIDFSRAEFAWDESKRKRGQPKNKGQFAKKTAASGKPMAAADPLIVAMLTTPEAKFGDPGDYIQNDKTGKVYGPFKGRNGAMGAISLVYGQHPRSAFGRSFAESESLSKAVMKDWSILGTYGKGEMTSRIRDSIDDLEEDEVPISQGDLSDLKVSDKLNSVRSMEGGGKIIFDHFFHNGAR